MRTISAPARAALAVALLVTFGCGGGRQASAPVAEKTAAPAEAPFNIASIFPPGEGRELVLGTCGACHPVVCSARGQRTVERWESIRKSHQDKLTGQANANVEAMFTYLKRNFNETKPEPAVPAALAEQGCAPF